MDGETFFHIEIPGLNEAEQAFFKQAAEEFDRLDPDNPYPALNFFGDSDEVESMLEEGPGFGVDIQPGSDKKPGSISALLTSNEDNNDEGVVTFLRIFLRRFRPQEVIAFEIGYSGDRPGGVARVISAEHDLVRSTDDLVEEMERQLRKQVAEEARQPNGNRLVNALRAGEPAESPNFFQVQRDSAAELAAFVMEDEIESFAQMVLEYDRGEDVPLRPLPGVSQKEWEQAIAAVTEFPGKDREAEAIEALASISEGHIYCSAVRSRDLADEVNRQLRHKEILLNACEVAISALENNDPKRNPKALGAVKDAYNRVKAETDHPDIAVLWPVPTAKPPVDLVIRRVKIEGKVGDAIGGGVWAVSRSFMSEGKRVFADSHVELRWEAALVKFQDQAAKIEADLPGSHDREALFLDLAERQEAVRVAERSKQPHINAAPGMTA